MELLKLSKFKLQLQSLISEVRDLRDRERSATEQHHQQIQRDQRQKQNEEELNKKILELQEELASVKEERHKLERKVNCLKNDNAMLENKNKELKGTLNSVLQSRENFVHAYEESTAQMKHSIETKDRMISVLSEKINSHLLLFDSIEKEVFYVKQIVEKVQNLVNDKEEVVTSLRNKMDRVSTFEKEFVAKITDLRNRLENSEAELRRKDRVISQLEAKLDAARLSNNNQAHIEEISVLLHSNSSEHSKALQYEVGSLRHILQRIQDTIMNMNEEDKMLFSSILFQKEACTTDLKTANNRMEDTVPSSEEKAHEST
ncbi:hypothetical protein PIB30_000372 [Stylosanthes scabra]|uniref:Uncharacterized protein n=1 Tax=Stylosanthes scabra TaxID=79078 RepID=A0ABU6U2J5_9FABA|nr:hypothetical protein [Stylosanthes scabra]